MAFTDDKVFDTSYTPDLPVIDEAATNPNGVTIATLLPEGSIYQFFPVDSLFSSGVTRNDLTVSSFDGALGSWQYSLNGGISWSTVVFGSDVYNGGGDDLLRFIPNDYNDFSSPVSLSVSFVADETYSYNSAYFTGVGGYSLGDTIHYTSFDSTWYDVEISTDNGATWNDLALNEDFVVATNTIVRAFADTPVTENYSIEPVVIAINAFDTSLGTWQYSTDGGTNWLTVDAAAVNSPSTELSLVLDADDQIRLLPFGTLNGDLSSALTFRAADYTDLSPFSGQYVISSAGGSYSASTDTVEVSIAESPNQAPFFDDDYGTTLFNVGGGTPPANDYAQAVALQADGKILIAGSTSVYDRTEYSFVALGQATEVVLNEGGTTPALTLTADTSGITDADGLTSPTFSYQWKRNGVDIAGETGSSYSVDVGVDGSTGISVEVSFQDDLGNDEVRDSNTKIVAPEDIYVAGVGVVRLNIDGTLDTTFGDAGKVEVNVGPAGTDNFATSMVIQPDGKIVLGGSSEVGGEQQYTLVRINENGALISGSRLDQSFGSSGVTTTTVTKGSQNPFVFVQSNAENSQIRDIDLDIDGNVVAAGFSAWGSNADNIEYALRFYDPSGDMYQYVDTNGWTRPVDPYYFTSQSGNQSLNAVLVTPGQEHLLAGSWTTQDGYGHALTDYYVARLTTAGWLDVDTYTGGIPPTLIPGFSGDGQAVVSIGPSALDVDTAVAVFEQTDGKTVVVGQTGFWLRDEFYLDYPDTPNDVVVGIAGDGVDHDSNTLSVSYDGLDRQDGTAVTYQWQQFTFETDPGDIIPTWDWRDVGTPSTGYEVDLDDIGDQFRAVVSYTNTDGDPATEISETYSVEGFYSVYDTRYSAIRLDQNGNLDTSYAAGSPYGAGKLVIDVNPATELDQAQSAVMLPDNSVLISGFTEIINTLDVSGTTIEIPDYDFSIIKLDSTGALDTSFGDGGKVVLPVGDGIDVSYDMTVQPDGKILIVGASNNGTDNDFSVLRLNPDGTVDSGFLGVDGPSSGGGSVDFVEDAGPVVLYETLGVYDPDLSILPVAGERVGNYDGATLTLSRLGGADSEDVFSGTGDLVISGASGNVVLDGIIIGTFTNGSGQLDIEFGSNATEGLVNELLASIGYENTSHTPPATVTIEFVFSDQNTGAQGSGGALTDTVTRLVNLTPVNDDPTGSVTAAGTAEQGQTLTADTTSDPLEDLDGIAAFSYQWQRDGSDIAGATSNTYLLTQDDVDTDVTVIVSYTDLEGTDESVTSAPRTIANVNDDPTGDVTISGSAFQHQTLTAVTTTIADLDGLGPFSYQWQRDGVDIGGANSDTYLLTQDDVDTDVTVIVSYTDGYGASESLTSSGQTIANVNDDPTGSVIIDGTPTQGQTLTADTTTDLVGDLDGLGPFSYQWYRNGSAITGADAGTYVAVQDDVDAAITVTVSYTDGFGAAESLASAPATIANINDAPTGSVGIDGTPTQGETLTADILSDPIGDLDGLGTFSYQWLRGAGLTPIAGATSSSYLLVQDDVLEEIRVRVSYTDQQGTAESLTSDPAGPVTDTNIDPTGGVEITGTLIQGATLTADSSSLYDDDGLPSPATYLYQWRRNGVDIPGANAGTYVLTQDDVGSTITVQLRYTDLGSTVQTVVSDPTGTITDGPSPHTGGVVITGTPTQGEVLTADSSTLADQDGLPNAAVYDYQWMRNGVDIPGATGSTYQLVQDDVGLPITVELSYVDLEGYSEVATSPPTANIADAQLPPTGSVIITGAPAPGGTLTADISTVVDPDGFAVPPDFSYQWYLNGGAIPGATDPTYVVQSGDLSGVLTVVVNFTDAEANPESLTSSGVSVLSGGNSGGFVYYWNTPHTLLEGVDLEATSDNYGPFNATTDAGGNFTFQGLPTDTYEVTTQGDVSTLGSAVTAADALAALKIAVGINPNDPDGDGPLTGPPVSPFQFIAADVNQDGVVSSADALEILRMAVGADTAMEDEWFFLDDSTELWDEVLGRYAFDRNHVNWDPVIDYNTVGGTGLNLVGVVKGDVNGSWASAGDTVDPAYISALAVDLGVPLDFWGI